MAIITIKQPGRGRPIKFDIDAEFEKLDKYVYAAHTELERVRQKTSGLRGDYLIGYTSAMPQWYDEAVDLLKAARDRRINLTAQQAREIRQAGNAIKRLASTQRRSRAVALEPYFTQEILGEIERAEARADSDLLVKKLAEYRESYLSFSKEKRVKFATSRSFQNVVSIFDRAVAGYERINTWVGKNYGSSGQMVDWPKSKPRPGAESMLYVILDRRARYGSGDKSAAELEKALGDSV